jgi:hypothetical protein
MNEKIKTLAKVAGYDEINKTAMKLLGFDPEKFAELIVKECIKESMEEIVSDENIEHESDPLHREYLKGNNQGIVDAVVRFRNHFGVEE